MVLMFETYCLWRARRNYLQLPEVMAISFEEPRPLVSIIIPARNEERHLPRLLDSLAKVDYLETEIIVVDDGSTDHTREIAASYSVQLIRIEGPPTGWLGKPHACHVGQKAARGQWLLFLDADTTYAPDVLTAALAYAKRYHLVALSLFPHQRCETFWEKMLLPYAYSQFFVGVDARRVNDATASEALANGQFILIYRQAYDHIGGHEAIRASVIDDVALAQRLKHARLPFHLARGEALGSVRMYTSLKEIWRGFSKNSFRFVQQNPRSGSMVIASSIIVTSAPVVGALSLFGPPPLVVLGVLLAVLPVVGLMPWYRSLGASWFHCVLYPVGAGVFQCIAVAAMLKVVLGQPAIWKDRPVRP
jgi:chlorobactene glucosyltransferase